MKDLNLIPKSYILRKKRKTDKLYRTSALVIVAAVIAAAVALPLLYRLKLAKELDSLEKNIKDTSNYVETEHQFSLINDLFKQREDEANKLNGIGVDTIRILGAIEKATPEKLFFRDINVDGTGLSDFKLNLSGDADSGDEIATLVSNLRNSGCFESVSINSVTKNGDSTGAGNMGLIPAQQADISAGKSTLGNNATSNNTASNNAASNNTAGNNTANNNSAGNNAAGNNSAGNNTQDNNVSGNKALGNKTAGVHGNSSSGSYYSFVITVEGLKTTYSTNNFISYLNGDYSFKIQYPKDWVRTDGKSGEIVDFISPQKTGSDVYRSEIKISAEDLGASPKSLDEYVSNSLDNMKKNITAVNIVSTKEQTVDNNSGQEVVYTGEASQKKLEWMQVFTIYGNKAYTITFSTEADRFSGYNGLFGEILKSFGFLY